MNQCHQGLHIEPASCQRWLQLCCEKHQSVFPDCLASTEHTYDQKGHDLLVSFSETDGTVLVSSFVILFKFGQ